MVGLLGCGCCQPNNEEPPPTSGCTVCDLIHLGRPADSKAFSDTFDTISKGWLLTQQLDSTQQPLAPNGITDYIRSGKAYFFKQRFISFFDFWTNVTRFIPPKPVPASADGKQPLLSILRHANLYFPQVQPRKYRFEITVNYPSDTLPRIGDPDYRPLTGVVGVFAIGPANFYINAQQLSIVSDTHPSATLSVGMQLTNPAQFPAWSPTFEEAVTVPFGQVNLRFEYTYNPVTNTGTRYYFVNDVLRHSKTESAFFFSPATYGTNCISACGVRIQLAAYEPWRQQSNPPNSVFPLWRWNGFKWLRGGGDETIPPPSFNTVSWTKENNPEDKLWFDNYSFDFVSP